MTGGYGREVDLRNPAVTTDPTGAFSTSVQVPRYICQLPETVVFACVPSGGCSPKATAPIAIVENLPTTGMVGSEPSARPWMSIWLASAGTALLLFGLAYRRHRAQPA